MTIIQLRPRKTLKNFTPFAEKELMRILIYTIFIQLLVSCSVFQARDLSPRTPSSDVISADCLKAAKVFDLDYITHPNRSQFKDVDHFFYFYETVQKYKIDEYRLFTLAADPDHNNFISIKSIREAQSVLIAERKDYMPGPIIRGPEEIDFYDNLGRPWDVKTPISPGDYDSWLFDIEKVKKSIRHQLGQTYANFRTQEEEPVRVLIDLRKTKIVDRHKVNGWIYGSLSPEEISRIEIIQ